MFAKPKIRPGIAYAVLVVGMFAELASFTSAADEDACDLDVEIHALKDLPGGRHYKRVAKQYAALPEDHKLRLEFSTISLSGQAVRHVRVVTPLNAKGQPDGLEIGYANWQASSIMRETPYVNGKRSGRERRLAGSTVVGETPWLNDKIHGVKKTYRSDGTPASETPYEHGVPHGAARTFNADGAVTRNTSFVNGKRDGQTTDYWSMKATAVKRIVTYNDGAVEGVSKSFYLHGQLKWERNFNDNRAHGVERHFDADGKLERERWWFKGEQVTEEGFKQRSREK